ncbi:MAG: sugar phosphate nucleotidyltransferase [Candidatus Thermoplasmatota archaeon]|nr:sugar phosphate nucleotidyltransferase [Candidatus Thermoplasmatota archaeon]
MKAVMLAAGEGKRMRPLTHTRPKVMLPIANRPLLEWNLVHAREAGIREFVMVVGYKSEMVRNYFGDGGQWDVDIAYVNQGRPQGTAHAVGLVKPFVDDFLVLSGDTVVGSSDLAALMKQEQAMGVVEVADAREYGSVELREGRVVAIHEKMRRPPSPVVNAGCYRLTPRIFECIDRTRPSPRGEYELTDSLTLLAAQEEIAAVFLDRWRDVGYPWDLLDANREVLEGLEPAVQGDIEEGVHIRGPVAIGEGTTVMSGSYIEGPVAIGAHCTIGPHCYLRPATSIGSHCHVGSACEVKNTILMDNSNIPHQNYVGDSVIGQHCNLGAGTKIANLRLDKKPVSVVADGAAVDTGRRKLGAIMGDHVQTGINAMLDVGTIVGNDVFIGPGAYASGHISPGARVL